MCTHEVKGGTWDEWYCLICGYCPSDSPTFPTSPSINREPLTAISFPKWKGPHKVFVMGSANLQVRVNGVLVTRLTLRRQMRSGYPDGPWEVVMTDPALGQFAIDDSFEIELKEVRKPWRKVFATELLTTLESVGATH